MYDKASRSRINRLVALFIVASLLAVGLLHLGRGYGDQLPNRSLTMKSGIVSASDTYRLDFSLPHAQTLGSIKIQFCTTGPLIDTPCDAPAGMSVSSATLSQQSGETGFSISNVGNANTIVIARPISQASIATTATNLSYTFTGVINPSSSGTFYARIQTFTSTDANALSATDYGGLALSVDESLAVTAVVPPYLYFCLGITITGVDCSSATGDYLNFGNFSSFTSSEAVTQMVAATNAASGYSIQYYGSTLTSGNDTIPPITAPDASRPGTSQFGLNLRSNTDPVVGIEPSGDGSGQPTSMYNQPNLYRFSSGDVLVNVLQPDLPRRYTTSYIANIAKTQAPGVYVSTLTYLATASF